MKTYKGNVEITENTRDVWLKELDGVECITGFLSIDANISLPSLKVVKKHLSVYAKAVLSALTTVEGNIYVHKRASLKADALETIIGETRGVKRKPYAG